MDRTVVRLTSFDASVLLPLSLFLLHELSCTVNPHWGCLNENLGRGLPSCYC